MMMRVVNVGLSAAALVAMLGNRGEAKISEPWDTWLDNHGCAGKSDFEKVICGREKVQNQCNQFLSILASKGCSATGDGLKAVGAAQNCVSNSKTDSWPAKYIPAYDKAWPLFNNVKNAGYPGCDPKVTPPVKTEACWQPKGTPSTWLSQVKARIPVVEGTVNAFQCQVPMTPAQESAVQSELAKAKNYLAKAKKYAGQGLGAASKEQLCLAEGRLAFAKKMCVEPPKPKDKDDKDKTPPGPLDKPGKFSEMWDKVVAWAKENLGSCSKIVELFNKVDLTNQLLKAVGGEFAATCHLQFKKGFICEIPDLVGSILGLLKGALEQAWEHKWVCGGLAIGLAPIAIPVLLQCGLGYYVSAQIPKIKTGVSALWACVQKLKAKEWWHIISGTACEIAGALVLEVAIAALTHGASAVAKVGHLVEKVLSFLMKTGVTPGKAIYKEIAEACGVSHVKTPGTTDPIVTPPVVPVVPGDPIPHGEKEPSAPPTTTPIGEWTGQSNNYPFAVSIAKTQSGYSVTITTGGGTVDSVSFNAESRVLVFRRIGGGWWQWYRVTITGNTMSGTFSHTDTPDRPLRSEFKWTTSLTKKPVVRGRLRLPGR